MFTRDPVAKGAPGPRPETTVVILWVKGCWLPGLTWVASGYWVDVGMRTSWSRGIGGCPLMRVAAEPMSLGFPGSGLFPRPQTFF